MKNLDGVIESYYPRHASFGPDEHVTADYKKARFDPLVVVARSAFAPQSTITESVFDASRYERPLPPPCLRVRD